MTVLLEDAPPTTRNTAPTPYRWTLSKFHRLVESGLFTDCKVMMIDGKILEMPVDNPPHVTGVSLAVQLLQRIFGEGYYVRNQAGMPWKLDTDPAP